MQGINRRFKAMPIAALTPLAARMSASMYRCSIALAVSLVCGHVIGFRFYGGVAHTVGFCLLVLVIGAAMALIGDLIGIANENPEATTPLMLLPQLILGLLSVGLQPVERFPAWIQPFVRDQPVSQFVYALRALAGDSTPAARAVTLVRHRTGAGLVGGLHSDPGSAARSRFLEAAMMSVASEDKRPSHSVDVGDARHPRSDVTLARTHLGGSFRTPGCSPRDYFVGGAAILRPCVESLVMPVALLGGTEHRFGRTVFPSSPGTALSMAASR